MKKKKSDQMTREQWVLQYTLIQMGTMLGPMLLPKDRERVLQMFRDLPLLSECK